MCEIPYMIIRLNSPGSLQDCESFCKRENGVHIGEPISSIGFSLLTSSNAFARLDGLSKSHGLPSSGSTTVRSKAKPRLRPMWPASADTLGGEYTYETLASYDTAPNSL